MSFTVVIPARYASTRLPGKPLAEIAGQSMIERVYHQAQLSNADQVVVATDDERIEAAVQAFGGKVCMTREDHPSGTDRIQEVSQQLGLAADHIVVNVQGDEPLIPPTVINQVAENLAQNSDASVATLSEPIVDIEDFLNPNIVKVASSLSGMALNFSRAPMPWPRDHFAGNDIRSAQTMAAGLPESSLFQRHIGIYAYRVSLLNEYITWPPSPLEQLESLEQLRVLWNGHRIHVQPAAAEVPGGVDTPEDLERLRAMFQ